MTDHEFAQSLAQVLSGEDADDEFPDPAIGRIASFEKAGVLTRDAGFVVRLEDGSEFQITVVQSRRAG